MDNLPISEFLIIIILVTGLSRFIRQANFTASWRQNLSARSSLIAKLLSCPHCLGFWLTAIILLIWWCFFPLPMLHLAALFLLSWRGAYYLNRWLDHSPKENDSQQSKACYVCGKSYNKKTSIKREDYYFCSYNCWFDLLKKSNQSPLPKSLFDTNGAFINQETYPMSYDEVSPTQAQELLASNQGYIYVDVRSVAEFNNGHPTGAYNIPIMHREPVGMVPNPNFLQTIETHFPRDSKLLIGCLSGARSARAAQALANSGYSTLTNIKGGFGGTRTPTGQVAEQGWAELGLPVSQQAEAGKDYDSLAG